MKKLPLILVADNVRSAHNVGSLFRTADGAGIEKLILTGITPHPRVKNDSRPPYEIEKTERAIAKTALGAEQSVAYDYSIDCTAQIKDLKKQGRYIYALEQTASSKNLFKTQINYPAVLVLGQELGGVSPKILELTDEVIEIPMHGSKDSLNVSIAAGIALFELRRTYK